MPRGESTEPSDLRTRPMEEVEADIATVMGKLEGVMLPEDYAEAKQVIEHIQYGIDKERKVLEGGGPTELSSEDVFQLMLAIGHEDYRLEVINLLNEHARAGKTK